MQSTWRLVLGMLIAAVHLAYGQFGGGSGTELDPYLIGSPAHLDAVRTLLVSTGSVVYCEQTQNIDLSGTNWVPIGVNSDLRNIHYDGQHDGQQFKILGLNINTPAQQFVGLFGWLTDGAIRNVVLDDGSIQGFRYAGSLVGYLNGGTIEDCYSTVSVSASDFGVGGLVGWSDQGAFSRVFVRDAVVQGGSQAGGVVGHMTGGSLVQCYAAVSVTNESAGSFLGGLVGLTEAGASVSSCYWDTQISGQLISTGGGTGTNTASMMQRSTFTSWDFDTVWQLYQGHSYPYLRALADDVEIPVFSPGSGPYPGSSVTVTATCAIATATIHYTIGRTTPTDLTTNTVASGGSISVTIIGDTTLNGVAWFPYMNPSVVSAATYTPAPRAETPTVDQAAGEYPGTNLSVVLSSDTTNATIHYTTDGSDPTEASASVSSGGAVDVPIPSVLWARAYHSDLNQSLRLEVTYGQMPTVATPLFSPDGGAFPGSSISVTVTCDTAGATIYYTTNGIPPTTNSSPVVANGTSVSVPVPGVLKAQAWADGYTASDIQHVDYSDLGSVDTPMFFPDGGTIAAGNVSVTVSCGTVGATIRYSTDGSDPDETNPVVVSGQPVMVAVPGTLKAKAWELGLNASVVKSNNYTTAGVVAMPTFSPDSGIGMDGSVNVTLSCTTGGAVIHYTTNGMDPTSDAPGVMHGTVISVSLLATLKAKAFKSELFSSPIRSAYYGDFAGGVGSEQDPYRIATAVHLDRVRNHLGSHFVMIDDINLDVPPWNSGEGWLPIDDGGDGFMGVFDGGGHVISNLYIDRPTSEYIGLFGYVGTSGRILNLGILSESVSGKSYVGGLAGTNVGTISNTFTRCAVFASISYAGGLVGSADPGSLIADAYATGNVTSAFSRAGGLIGLVNASTIRRCYAVGAVGSPSEAGGLIGQALSGTPVASYWDTQTSGQDNPQIGLGKLTSEMQQQSTFVGWDFSDIWRIDEGVDYPRLRLLDPLSSSVPPDGWVIRFYGSVAAAPENSVKGDPLWWEYVAGTDPTDLGSVLAIDSIAEAGVNLTLTVNSVTGRLYGVEGRSNLTAGAWQTVVGGDEQSGNGEGLGFDLPISWTSGFYRVRVRLDE